MSGGRRAPWLRTIGLARPQAGRMAFATLLGAATVAAGIGLLATSGWLISRAAEQPSIAELGFAIVAVRFFAVFRGVFRYSERLVGHDAAFRSLADLRVRVYERLERLAPSGLPVFGRGDLLARLVDDVDELQDLTLRVIPPWAIAALVGTATVGLLWWVLPAAGAVVGVTLLVAATLVPWLTRRLACRSEVGRAAARSELTVSMVELLEGAPDLAAFGATGGPVARVEAADAQLTRMAGRAASTAGLGAALTTLLVGLAVWGAVVVGVPAVSAGRLDGVWLAVLVLTPLAAFELTSTLPVAAHASERVRRSAARVFDVLDAAPVVTDPVAPATLPAPPWSLVLRNVRVRYRDDGPWALDGVDLDLTPGRRVAVVGPSGAGKSTLASVLVRFLPYERGSARLGGVELADLHGDDVRRVVGLVQQDAHLFDTTMRENLLLAHRAATDAELLAALARVRLLDWVNGLPAGLDTEVGEHGHRLSGGQRQRLALARALLADFPMLVLDEPGEHLDVEAADALAADLVDATAGRTTLLITHRLAALPPMDEILVLGSGRVVERGSHLALVRAGGHYARLWHREQSFSPSARPLGGAPSAVGVRRHLTPRGASR